MKHFLLKNISDKLKFTSSFLRKHLHNKSELLESPLGALIPNIDASIQIQIFIEGLIHIITNLQTRGKYAE